MKSKIFPFVLAAAAAILLSSAIVRHAGSPAVTALSADAGKDQVLMKLIMDVLESNHYQPQELNDEFSRKVFDLYLERLDYSKRFLLAQDVEALREYETKLDDQIKAGDFKFLDFSFELLQRRLKEAQGYYTEALEKPFDFEVNESIETDEEKRTFSKNRDELKMQWHRLLKYQVLSRISEMEERQAKAESDTIAKLTFTEIEAKARAGVKKNNDRFFERMSKWERVDQQEVFINSVLNVFCPHTGYFAPKDKENFDISMSGQLEGIGAQLQEEDGYIKVSSIIPGSPSYRQGELEEGDYILKVAQGSAEPVDITDMRLDEAVKLVRGKKGTEVRLTVKKPNGAIVEIAIVRDIVILEETYAKSAVITNESGARIGYIFLPKFYADFNKLGGRAAASDVEKELEKLKAEGIDGIVLDLRNNGGGSLQDAVDMTGLFISSGPVVQVKSRFAKPRVLTDTKSAVVYDGPLVVMVNHFSASASEILAAAIQDYDRGVIIGAESSFGKGTVQKFVALDPIAGEANSQYRPLGEVKLTSQKFYRISGATTQLEGVVPDIKAPDQYNYLEVGEKEHDYALGWDQIDPADYRQWKPLYNEQQVIEASLKRMAASPALAKVNESSKRLKEQNDQSLVSLRYTDFVALQRELEAANKELDELLVPIEPLIISNAAADLAAIEADTVKTDLNQKWLKKLKKDPLINEAVYVVGDMKTQAVGLNQR